MLTKDLLSFSVRKGAVRPRFVDVDEPALSALADRMVALVEPSIGLERRSIEAALSAEAGAFKKSPKIGRGLAKLLLDRMDFGEAGEEAAELREQTFEPASEVLRSLPEGADFEAYEAALAERFGDLTDLRERLFSDLAELRPLVAWKKLSGEGLLHRYNLALAQGLVLYADRLTLTLEKPDLKAVRRLLSWLKFCRLVADLSKEEERWRLTVEGPGAILSMQKKYGLQLATFLGAVPICERFEVTATVRPPKKREATLTLTEKDPLVCSHRGSPGHVPEEIQRFVETFDDARWNLDTTPDVRHVGVSDVCVPDFVLRRGDTAVAVELFHRWHRSSLLRRLDALQVRPDPTLFLGVDRSLLDDELEARIEGSGQVFRFSAFPSKRALKKLLERFTADQ